MKHYVIGNKEVNWTKTDFQNIFSIISKGMLPHFERQLIIRSQAGNNPGY